ncbi:hypothetical protein SLITO_v1c01360 [Spiroplasma litorale]|uniref:Transmembrane protein n=1 Tax=Spiroplasma litorale TaxID=216942 RepID=A0A0K1W141_9MOLU|nr:Pr6Pr family membrane protein [Spiroplasma litorale]AKX33802.1 hypothetical protein SLITO_v1c01360 [Spiroplasma litorale]
MKINKNLELSIKIILLISLVSFLIFDMLLQMYSPKENMYGIPLYDRIDIYFSFFTTQSNYIVVGYLVLAILYKQICNSRLSFGVELAITVYITLTMVVFWLGIAAPGQTGGETDLQNWISTIILHLIIPLIMIAYFILSCGNDYISYKKHLKFNFPVTCTYPALYLFFVMLRGHYRFKLYSPTFYNDIYSNSNHWIWSNLWTNSNGVIDKSIYYDTQMWYPYWFLNLNRYELSSNGVVHSTNMNQPYWVIVLFFLAGILSVIFLITSFQFLYLKINNIKFYNWHDINGNLISKKEHDIKKAKIRQIRKDSIKMLRVLILTNISKNRSFKKNVKSLPKHERIEAIKKYNNILNLEKKLFIGYKKRKDQHKKDYKKYIKKLIQEVGFKDRMIIKDNLREAERFKKLVKKGIIISRSKYVD